jgi:hypothetical protein
MKGGSLTGTFGLEFLGKIIVSIVSNLAAISQLFIPMSGHYTDRDMPAHSCEMD